MSRYGVGTSFLSAFDRGHLASIGQLVAEEAHRPAVVGAGTCSLPAGLIDDSMIECQFIHVQLLNYH